jgi:hypothetical protein
MSRVATLALVALLVACSGGELTEPKPSIVASPTSSLAATPPTTGWVSLASRSWTFDPASDGYVCKRVSVTEDSWVTGFRAVVPDGSHHVVVTLSDETTTGDVDCARGNLEPRILYAASPTTGELTLPDGVALHLAAGQILTVGVHAINLTNAPLSGTTGVEANVVPKTEGLVAAEVVLAGRRAFSVPAHAAGYTVEGGCVATHDHAVFAISPVMHHLGSYQRAAVTHDGMATVIRQGLFTFGEERVQRIDPIAVLAGDRVDVSCSYDNLTDSTASYGAGAADETCFAVMMRYPATGGDAWEWVAETGGN